MMDALWTLNRITEVDAMRLTWESTMVLIVDETQRIQRSTSEVNKFFGYVPGELDGAFLEVLIPPAYRNIHAQHFAKYFTDPVDRTMGVDKQQHVFDGWTKKGELVKVSIWLRVRAVDGQKVAVAKVFPVFVVNNSL